MGGASVRVITRKWPDRDHWEYDALALGADAHGYWVGIPRGTLLARPGRAFHAEADHVTLVPHDSWWLATFYGTTDEQDAMRPCDVYVDVATPARGAGTAEVVSVDLDLDVIRSVDGTVWLDDEDEFAEHRRTLGYPAEVVRSARASAAALLEAVEQGTPPFDPVIPAEWIARLRRRLRERPSSEMVLGAGG